MRLAVLGVGLIGGSIGLAAQAAAPTPRSAGFDPDRGHRASARLELGALDRTADSIAEAVDGAEIVFCAAPVGVARPSWSPRRSRRAARTPWSPTSARPRGACWRRSFGRARGAIHRRPPAGRRRDRRGRERARRPVRGRPLVPDADRALERRPLRPPPAHDRRPRRPSAGDRRRDPRPADGDRQPPAARDRQRARPARRPRPRPRSPSACPRSARASATRPGSPARTRPSGATSSSPTARPWPARSRRSPSGSREAAELIRSGDAGPGRRLARRGPRGPPPPARGRSDRRRAAASSGWGWRTGRGPSPRSPWRWAAPASTSRTWRCIRLPTCAPARSRCGSPASAEAERAAGIVRGLGHGVSVSRVTRFAPSGPLRGTVRAPARQVDQPPRGADRRRWGRGRRRSRATSTPPTRGRPSTRSRRSGQRSRSSARRARPVARSAGRAGSGCVARGAIRPRREPVPIDVENAGTLLRILPGWLAGQADRRVDPRRRRVDPPASG